MADGTVGVIVGIGGLLIAGATLLIPYVTDDARCSDLRSKGQPLHSSMTTAVAQRDRIAIERSDLNSRIKDTHQILVWAEGLALEEEIAFEMDTLAAALLQITSEFEEQYEKIDYEEFPFQRTSWRQKLVEIDFYPEAIELSHLGVRFSTGGLEGRLFIPAIPSSARELAHRLRNAAQLGGLWHDRYAAGSTPLVMQNGEPPRIAVEQRRILDQLFIDARAVDAELASVESRYQDARLNFVVTERLFDDLSCDGLLVER